MATLSRRQFLEDSMFAAAAAAALGSGAAIGQDKDPGDKPSKSANERLSVAVVGAGGRGGDHLGAFSKRPDTEVTYICDADSGAGMKRVEEIAKRQERRPIYVQDMRKIFEDKSVDIVTTATPNHWHSLVAIWAMQAGKDVYVEKPVSHNVSEGRRAVETARKYKRICQTGTQSRSNPGMKAMVQYLHDGKLGAVKLAHALCYKRRGSIGARGMYPIPANVNYDLWCGPAPVEPLTRPKLHYDWHWVWSTGNGDLGNQGIHQMDLARWGLNLTTLSKNVLSYGGRLGYIDAGDTANTQVVIHDYGDKTLVFEVRGLATKDYKGAGVGVIFEGSEGYLVMTSYGGGTAFDREGKPVKTFRGGGDHYENFLKAVRSRKHEDLNADIEEGHLSSALCHTGNISYRLGKPVTVEEATEQLKTLKTSDDVLDTFERTRQHLVDNKVDLAKTKLQFGPLLVFDPKSETFVDNKAADKMLTREYRKPYVVPEAGKV